MKSIVEILDNDGNTITKEQMMVGEEYVAIIGSGQYIVITKTKEGDLKRVQK